MLKFATAAFLLFFAVFPSTADEPTLEVLARYEVAGEPSSPVDVRWAPGESVYLARAHDGVWQLALDDGLTAQRQLMPGTKELPTPMGSHPLTELAVAGNHLAAGHFGSQIDWRSTERRPDRTFTVEKERFAIPVDLDARGDRLVVLGGRGLDDDHWEGDGGVLWIGSFSRGLEDLRPVMHVADVEEVAGDRFTRCSSFGLGAVRFLTGGTFLAVPGFVPGAHLYSPSGRLLRSWSDEEIGIDTAAACEALDVESSRARKFDEDLFRTWRDDLRIVDDVLALPGGPGLLVRSVGEDGLPRWQLRVLAAAEVETYSVPVVGERPDDSLHGDVRGDRILLLRYAGRPADNREPLAGELLVARLP